MPEILTIDLLCKIFSVHSGDMDIDDGEINDGCGNIDRILLKIYTTSCHDKLYRHGYICQYEGKCIYIKKVSFIYVIIIIIAIYVIN